MHIKRLNVFLVLHINHTHDLFIGFIIILIVLCEIKLPNNLPR